MGPIHLLLGKEEQGRTPLEAGQRLRADHWIQSCELNNEANLSLSTNSIRDREKHLVEPHTSLPCKSSDTVLSQKA